MFKNFLNSFGKSLIIGIGFSLGIILVYAATTVISGLGGNIEVGNKIGTGWFNEVDNKLSKLDSNISINEKNVGIGISTPVSKLEVNGNMDMNENAIKGINWQNSNSPFAWATIDLYNTYEYTASDGIVDGGLTVPSNGNFDCSDNQYACVENIGGNYFRIGIVIPDDATIFNRGGGANAFCWPVALGDSEPYEEDTGVDWYGVDNAGQNMGHCVNGAPDNDRRVVCIKTVGIDTASNAGDYGIVCPKGIGN